MSLRARKELLSSLAPRYVTAGRREKRTILDEFTAATGYHRKSAIRLLTNPPTPPQRKRRNSVSIPKRRKRRYDEGVQKALEDLWETSGRICSKRLVPFLPRLLGALEQHGRISLPTDVRERLLSLSPATADRLLRDIKRRRRLRGIGTTKPGSLLKHHVRVRTFSEWDDARPGFVEADLVAHCGTSMAGMYLHSLTMTDVSSGWTECMALLYRDQEAVVQGLQRGINQLPFPLAGLDTDNGTEFLNRVLIGFCEREHIEFTRSRPYRKNDQCHVEQKNGAVVRRFVGYDRYEGQGARWLLADLYQVLRLYVNFFQPSMKLVEKRREGSKIIKTYDEARTPCERLLASDQVEKSVKKELRDQYATLDPVFLLEQIRLRQNAFWRHAHCHAPARGQVLRPGQENLDNPMRSSMPYSGDGALEPAYAVIAPDDENRTYRRTKRKNRCRVPHTWRTRPDPFESVWPDVEAALEQSPHTEAKTLFVALQKNYPGKFSDGQLRTLQRRVKAWRTNFLHTQCDNLPSPELLVIEPQTATRPG